MNDIINIRYGQPGPAGGLSNLYPRKFNFRGVKCGSIEGVLRGMQFPNISIQQECALLHGHTARRFGDPEPWWKDNQFYWGNIKIHRHGDEYQDFLDELYTNAFVQDKQARAFLLSTGNAKLIHTVGETNPNQTLLTVKEFCGRLIAIRDSIRATAFFDF